MIDEGDRFLMINCYNGVSEWRMNCGRGSLDLISEVRNDGELYYAAEWIQESVCLSAFEKRSVMKTDSLA